MKKRWTISVGVAFIAVLAHIETIGYWFVTSDILALTVSSRAATINGVIDIFTQPLMAGTSFTNNALFYRPLMSLSYTLDYALWGLDPTGYHLTNLVLHSVAVALSVLVVNAITDLETGSLAGLLVAAHPLTAEVVPAASRRDSVLMSVFLLTALFMLVRGRQRDSRWLHVGSVAAYAFALLSKELSILFLGLAFMWVVFGELDVEDSTSQNIVLTVWTALRYLIPFILVSVAYVGVRVAVLGGLGGYDQTRPLTLDTVFEIVTKYVMSIAYPQDIISALIGVVGLDPLRILGGCSACSRSSCSALLSDDPITWAHSHSRPSPVASAVSRSSPISSTDSASRSFLTTILLNRWHSAVYSS
ncbi:glycosyltransferase family 39 protein [Haladaptatus pallidirubidus]|uniref:glycosyltransferase family 39 protein n=1 Tax=Haladaptatus pallidirubidus TaxID=1008152 RepID=UPI0035F052A5